MSISPVSFGQAQQFQSYGTPVVSQNVAAPAVAALSPDEIVKKNKNKKLLIGAGIAVATVGAVVGLGVLAKKGKLGDSAKQFMDKIFKPKNVKTTEALDVVQKTADELKTKAQSEFCSNATAFDGIYEPLYRVSEGNSRNGVNVINDWGVRIENMRDAANLQKYFGEMKLSELPKGTELKNADKDTTTKIGKKLYDFITGAGVKRSDNNGKIIEIADDTYRLFSTDSGKIIEKGNKAKVLFPNWTLGDKVIAKGEITLDGLI